MFPLKLKGKVMITINIDFETIRTMLSEEDLENLASEYLIREGIEKVIEDHILSLSNEDDVVSFFRNIIGSHALTYKGEENQKQFIKNIGTSTIVVYPESEEILDVIKDMDIGSKRQIFDWLFEDCDLEIQQWCEDWNYVNMENYVLLNDHDVESIKESVQLIKDIVDI